MMKKRIPVVLLFLLLSTLISFGQVKTAPPYKNSVKWNLLGMVFKNASLLYERELTDHWTAQAGVAYRWGGSVPAVLGLGDLIVTSESQGLQGFSITPEIRYYFNFCKCGESASGLYAGLYYRYTKFDGDLDFYYWDGNQYVDAIVATDFREMGGGIQIGYQFIIKKRFLVDMMFAGPRLSSNKIRFGMDSDYVEDLIPIIEEEINQRLEWLGLDPISIDPSPEAELKFGFRNFRYAIGIGFLF